MYVCYNISINFQLLLGVFMKVASMFAGVGGICLAFRNAGGTMVWANEIDEKACITYRANFGGGYLVEDDIRRINAADIPDFDVLTAGFPCQAFSIAGYRNGFNDDRGNLFFDIVRVLAEKRPRAFLLENVKNLVGHDQGRTFARIRQELDSLGYYFKHDVLNALNYGNLPQNRERTFIVGFSNPKAYELFEFPGSIELTKTIHDIINPAVQQEDYYYYTADHQYFDQLDEAMTNENTVYQWRRVYVRENQNNVCPTLTANMGTGGHNVPIIRDDFGIRKLTPRETFLFQGFPEDYILPEGMSRSHLYKQAGNAVPVPVITRIAENIRSVLIETEELPRTVEQPEHQ